MEKKSKEPNSKMISDSIKKCQLVVAAAGSGKTKLLVETLAYKISKKLINLEKNHIVVFTFTNNAADELIVRLGTALEPSGNKDAINKMFIGTIHGWCDQYLEEKGTLANTKVIAELEQTQIVQRIYDLLRLEELYTERHKFLKIKKFLADLEIFYNENISITDKRIPKNVAKAIDRYQDFLRRERLMDFGTLIKEATKKLSEEVDSKPFEVFVDEYQDVNPAQVDLFRGILKSNNKSRLVAVGDPRQSIYQWRGSDVERIIAFNSDFNETEIYELATNYRSRTGIIEFANTIANDMQFSKKISISNMKVSDKRKDKKISVFNNPNPDTNVSEIVQLIKDLINNECEPNDIAILLRSVIGHGQDLMNALEENNIPFYSPNRNRGTEFVSTFMDGLIKLIKIAEEPPIPQNMEEEKEISENIQKWLTQISNFLKEKNTTKIHKAVSNWHKKLQNSRNEGYNLRRQFFDFCLEIGFVIEPHETDLQEGFSAVTQIMKSIEEAYRRRFQGVGSRPSPINILIHNLSWELTQHLERWYKVGMNMKGKSGVIISTVHAAKGLEWPIVIMPYMWERKFPLRASSHGTSFPDEIAKRYGTTIEDEKRLWYVAATRPRDRLFIFSGGNSKYKPSKFAYNEFYNNKNKNIAISSDKLELEKMSVVERFDKPTYINIGLSDYLLLLECQYHFYLRKICGLQVPVGEELGAGDIIHKVLQKISQEKDISKLESIIDEEVFLPLAELKHEQNMKKTIKKKVEKIVKSGILDSINNAEYKFAERLDNVIVSGIVDAIRDTGKSLEIIDWKSNVHKEFLERYQNQLLFYAGALRNLGKNVSAATIIDLGKTGKDAEIFVDISNSKVNAIITKGLKSLKEIEKGLPHTEPSSTSCAVCDVSHICPDRIGSPKKI